MTNELAIIRYGNGTQIVEVSGSTRTGKVQLAARYSITKSARGIFVERKTTSAKVDPAAVLGTAEADWRRQYVDAHMAGTAERVTGLCFAGRDITRHA